MQTELIRIKCPNYKLAEILYLLFGGGNPSDAVAFHFAICARIKLVEYSSLEGITCTRPHAFERHGSRGVVEK